MNVKLIAFDLDGTLLDDDKHLPPENLAALQAAHMQGIFLVPATGRILKALPEELLAPGLFRYFIWSSRRFTGPGSSRNSRYGSVHTWTHFRCSMTVIGGTAAI